MICERASPQPRPCCGRGHGTRRCQPTRRLACGKIGKRCRTALRGSVTYASEHGGMLLDTDLVVDALRGLPLALTSLDTAEQQGMLATSIPPQLELLIGRRSTGQRDTALRRRG